MLDISISFVVGIWACLLNLLAESNILLTWKENVMIANNLCLNMSITKQKYI